MTGKHVRPRVVRVLIASAAALILLVALLEDPGRSRGAAGVTRSSSEVAVIPGFDPPAYPDFFGVPALPVHDSQLASYHFTELAANKVTPAALRNYDTVILYAIRWNDISASAQAAINAFATTHKVLIWDSDGTGSQSYATFIHPFSQTASGENFKGKPNGAVVFFPSAGNFLASDKPSSPYYLEPTQLVTDRDLINDMNAMTTGTKDWTPALVAANASMPRGGWPIAWSYGNIGNNTGLTIYSGIDTDAFTAKLNPNDAIRALAIQLQAPFRETPEPSCAPGCDLPPPPPQSPPPGGGSTYASCGFARPLPKRWLRGRVFVNVKTSVAAGITGKIITRSGKVVASGRLRTGRSVMRLALRTRRLPSNRTSRLHALVFVNGQRACSKPFRVKVDNVRPRLLRLTATRAAGRHLLTVRVSERALMTITGAHMSRHRSWLSGRRTYKFRLPAKVRVARLVLRDRAGSKVVRRVVWR
jgi:hypothetical protein